MLAHRCRPTSIASHSCAHKTTVIRGRQLVVASHSGSTSSIDTDAKRQKHEIKGSCVVKLRAKTRVDTPVKLAPGVTLTSFLQESPNMFHDLDMPLGGKVRMVEDAPGLYELTIPRMQLFNMWLAPKVTARLTVDNNKLVVGAEECTLTGSHHVQQLNLNDRFSVDVAISFTGHEPAGPQALGRIATDGAIEVQVDIPPPFAFTPKPVLEATGNAALAGSLAVLLNTLTKMLADECQKWAAARVSHSA